jgi:hypothetical protein
MVTVASVYLRFYMEVGVGVGTFLPTPIPPKIPSDSDSTAPLLDYRAVSVCMLSLKIEPIRRIFCTDIMPLGDALNSELFNFLLSVITKKENSGRYAKL